MGFTKGHRKIGGRRKGTPNKKTVMRVEELLLQLDISPIGKLIELAESDLATIDQKISCYKEIARYTYPRLKAQDIKIDHGQNLFDTVKVNIVKSN